MNKNEPYWGGGRRRVLVSDRGSELLLEGGKKRKKECVKKIDGLVRPFLMQSDSASRKRPFLTGLYFDWILLVLLLIVSRVDFIVFVLFLEAVGVRGYCCTAGEIGWQLCASRCLREQWLDEPSFQRVGALGLAKNRQSYVRGVALSREPPKLQQAQPLLAAWDRDRALRPSCDTRCWRAELGMRHADLLRAATAGIAKPASAPCMILQCGTWYGCVAAWPCVCLVVE